jgi:hypothetical protein
LEERVSQFADGCKTTWEDQTVALSTKERTRTRKFLEQRQEVEERRKGRYDGCLLRAGALGLSFFFSFFFFLRIKDNPPVQ